MAKTPDDLYKIEPYPDDGDPRRRARKQWVALLLVVVLVALALLYAMNFGAGNGS